MMDLEINKCVKRGWIKKLKNGKFTLTEKGKLEVENRILPSVGMTEKLFKTKDGLLEYFKRADQRDRIKKGLK